MLRRPDSRWPTAPAATATIAPVAPAPHLSAAPNLGAWLTASAPSGGTWSAAPQAIPATWAVNAETAIVHAINAGSGLSNVHIDLGVDNGIDVWLNEQYLFGATAPGGVTPGEYAITSPRRSPAGRTTYRPRETTAAPPDTRSRSLLLTRSRSRTRRAGSARISGCGGGSRLDTPARRLTRSHRRRGQLIAAGSRRPSSPRRPRVHAKPRPPVAVSSGISISRSVTPCLLAGLQQQGARLAAVMCSGD